MFPDTASIFITLYCTVLFILLNSLHENLCDVGCYWDRVIFTHPLLTVSQNIAIFKIASLCHDGFHITRFL